MVLKSKLAGCGEGVQTEKHVVVERAFTEGIRGRYREENVCFASFMNGEKSKAQLSMLGEILNASDDWFIIDF